MSSKELLQQRKLIGTNLKNYIRDREYTTILFDKKANIPYETLKQLLNGELNDETEFVDIIKKVANTLDIEAIEVKEEMNRLLERQENIINRLMNISSIQLDILNTCI